MTGAIGALSTQFKLKLVVVAAMPLLLPLLLRQDMLSQKDLSTRCPSSRSSIARAPTIMLMDAAVVGTVAQSGTTSRVVLVVQSLLRTILTSPVLLVHLMNASQMARTLSLMIL